MAKVLITGSSDGLGFMAGQLLLGQSHQVTFHARTPARADDIRHAIGTDTDIVVGDFASLDETRSVAEQANELGRHDALIHNAGIGYRRPARESSKEGYELTFAVNVLAPYLLTALMQRPSRLVYLSSGMHRGGNASLDDVQWTKRRWNGAQAYWDSKLFDIVLAFAMARRWKDVLSNAVEPGWVPTKMGGPGAPGDLAAAPVTQAWLATSDDPAATVSGGYWYHQRQQEAHSAASDPSFQRELLDYCASLTGAPMPD